MQLLRKINILRLAFLGLVIAGSLLAMPYVAADPAPVNSGGSGSTGNQSTAPSNTALCYNQLSAVVYECSGQGFQAGKCYIYNDQSKNAGTGWQETSCSLSQFQNIPNNPSKLTPVVPTTDQALTKCNSAAASNNQCGLIQKYVNPFIDFLSAIVGIAVVIGIIVGGIEYSTSAGDPQKATKAKDHILRAITALVAFIFLWAFLEWLVPGGFLNG